MLLFVNILYVILGSLGILLIAHKNKAGFVVFILVELCMLYIGVHSGQIGITLMAIVYAIFNVYGWHKWSSEARQR